MAKTLTGKVYARLPKDQEMTLLRIATKNRASLSSAVRLAIDLGLTELVKRYPEEAGE